MTTALPDLEQLLAAGIAAYKQGDYKQAIATLSKLSRTPSRTYRTKAGMGLVRVYMAQQEWAKAKSICQKIGRSSQPSIQQWATTTLEKIEARSPTNTPKKPISKSSPSGFVPLETAPPAVSMFHYAYLNGEDDPIPVEPSAAGPIPEAPPVAPPSYEWPNAGRLTKGRSLGKMKRSPLWFAQTIGITAFYALLLYLIYSVVEPINKVLDTLYRILNILPIRIGFFYLSPHYQYWAWMVFGVLFGLLIASPWLWDLWLRFTSDRQSFSIPKLRTYSPEAATLLGKRCQQHRWPLPTLWKLNTDVPLIFSYGWLPRNARLVVSEGLLSALSADEIAALVVYEVSHWKTMYWPLLSLQGLVLQLFHQVYWKLALWGNHQAKPVQWAVGIVATISYGIFWLSRLPMMWISRVRTYYGDRTTVEITGNPNGHARALAKLSFALASSIDKQGYTPVSIERLALMLPVSVELTRQSLYGTMPLAELFAWDSLNPLRNWMSVSDAHPPLGDRLRLIMAYARHWKLDSEIPLAAPPKRQKGLSQQNWIMLIGQGMPFFGLLTGLAIGISLLIVGAIGHWLQWPFLDWMYKDSRTFWFCPLMGLGLGTMLRINRFFPDLTFGMTLSQQLSQWISEPSLLPNSSLPAKFAGTIVGRPGIANWLGQDLMLKTSEGLLKLHFFSAIGPLGNAIGLQQKPAALLGKPVQVLGWFRRGNHAWIDIDKIRLNNGTLLQAAHPIASLLVAVVTAMLGLWLLGFEQFFQEATHKIFG